MVSYICLDGDEHPIDEGMATTVDISQGGILIETSRPIDSEAIILISIDRDKKILEIKGRVVYCRKISPSKHLTGIEFAGSQKEAMDIVKNIVIEFHHRQKAIR